MEHEAHNSMGALEDLPESRLGTKSHWDHLYETELENFEEHGDEGEIWFGKSCEKRIIDWICQGAVGEVVAEVGCGNGHLLVSLAKRNIFKSIYGLDYSEVGIEFAKKYAASALEATPQLGECLRFGVADLLKPEAMAEAPADIVIDKGTFDAISLGTLEDVEGATRDSKSTLRIRTLSALYKASIVKLLKSQYSLYVITSCNWTKEEMLEIFSPEFHMHAEIPHQSFSFGGRKGQDVTTIVFKIANSNK